MVRLAVGLGRVGLAALLLGYGGASARMAAGSPAAAPGGHEILVPGGAAALLRAAGVTVPVEAPRALLVLARTVHGPFAPPVTRRLVDALRQATQAAGQGGPTDRIPGLLPLAVWQGAVFGREVRPEELAVSIASDRRASFLYCGLFALDEETLRFFASEPGLVRDIYRRWTDVFAAYGEGVRIANGRVRLPGGEAAAGAWEAATGTSAAEPARFVEVLLGRDQGRLAQLLGALGRLDPPHLAFAHGPSAQHLPALIASARRFDAAVNLPFVAWSEVDVPFLLEHVSVTPDGRLAPPGGRWFWDAAFNGHLAAGPPGPAEITAPLLVDLFASVPRPDRRLRLDTLLFVQRRFAARLAAGGPGAGAPGAWRRTATAFGAAQTLLLALEQIGSLEPEDYEEAAAAATALAQGVDRPSASRRIAVFQAAVALIAQCARAGSLAPAAAQGLAADLVRAASASPDQYLQAVLDRVRGLLAQLPSPPRSAGFEGRLLDGLAGVGEERARRVIEWEGRRYRVDPATADRARLEDIRSMQGGWTLDAALEIDRALSAVVAAEATPAQIGQASAAILAAARQAGEAREERLFGYRVDTLLDEMRASAAAAVQQPDRGRSEETRRRLTAGLEVVTADALVAIVYALWLDPEAPLVAGDSLGRRHDFGLAGVQGVGPWTLPRPADPKTGSALQGSLLGVERCLARETLRTTIVGLPRRAPTLPSEDVRGLAESVLALNPWRLTDEGAALLSAALKRGRARIEAAAGRPDDLEAVLASAGVDGIRRRLARVAVAERPSGVFELVSLTEILALGREREPALPQGLVDRWGPAARVLDGSFGQRMPPRLAWLERAGRPGAGLLSAQFADLALRAAEWLSDRGLPAMLAPGVLSLATWDLAMTVQVAHPDDWLPLVKAAQGVPADRFEDYVSALAARGPLVPVQAGGK